MGLLVIYTYYVYTFPKKQYIVQVHMSRVTHITDSVNYE